MMKKIILLMLIIPVVASSGCLFGDEDYATATEQYSMGWILHNVNDSTSTDVTYSFADLAVYNYSYDYPTDQPVVFVNYFTFIAPVPNNMTDETIIMGNTIAVPINRTYYVMGLNPNPEYYRTNWSFYNAMEIDYAYPSHFEHYNSTNGYFSITPKPGDSFAVTFGKAPYTPTSFLVDSQSVRFSDYLIKGYIPRSYLLRDVSGFNYDEIPRYQIYLNDSLVNSSNAIDSSGVWNHTLFNYSFVGNGTYFINLSIPSFYPIWNITEVETVFYRPAIDMQPPILNHIEARPYFEHNMLYNISINVTDDVGIKNISAYYREDNAWYSMGITNNSNIYETNLTISNISFDSFDFKLSVNDTSDNQINYTISPLSLAGQNISITLDPIDVESFQGGIFPVSGELSVNGTSLDDLLIDFYSNNTKIGSAMTYYSLYSTNVRLPCGSDPNPDVTALFSGTGVYKSNETSNTTSISIIPLNFTADDTVTIHTPTIINASGYGAYLTINSSSWVFDYQMEDNLFFFTPHRYGNYTVSLSTSCGENISKTIFANITTEPLISTVNILPQYPLDNKSLSIRVSTQSQDQHNLVGNISNSTTDNTLNLSFSSYPYTDYYTSQPYNYSYCTNCWSAIVENLETGVYNVSLQVSDLIGQINNTLTTVYVYPEMNITFNATDFSNNSVNMNLSIGLDEDYNVYDYSFNGSVDINSIPNISYFDKKFHISIDRYINSDNMLIIFENSTISEDAEIDLGYSEQRNELEDKILYSTYFYNTSWSYGSIYMRFVYENANRFSMIDLDNPAVYACKDYNYQQSTCPGGWVDITSGYSRSGNQITVYGNIDDPQAVSFGEPQSCGDGYCSEYESCSLCVSDCGSCSSNPPLVESGNIDDDFDDDDSTQEDEDTDEEEETTETIEDEGGTTGYTISDKSQCPFECCVDETGYSDKPCDSGGDCMDNKCLVKPDSIFDNSYLWLMISAIPIAIVLAYILLGKQEPKKEYYYYAHKKE
ncbi:MAG: hypothetical protein ABIE55_03425 [Candidatus Aenigmatarchaeota archaeon]